MSIKVAMFRKSVVLLLLSLFLCSVHSWYNCNDVDFCTRNRNKASGTQKFSVDMTHLDINLNQIATNLVNQETGKVFSLDVRAITDSVYRVVIDDNENPRHRVEDALNPQITKSGMKAEESVVKTTRGAVTITTANSKAIIQTDPFSIEFYYGGVLISEVNADGLLVIEEREPEVAVGIDVLFLGAKEAYGLPSHPESIVLRDTKYSEPYRLYNIDRSSYGQYETQALYGAVPVLYAHSPKRTSGFFWLNSAQTFVDLERRSDGVKANFISESGAIDFFILAGPTFKDAVKQYASITGE